MNALNQVELPILNLIAEHLHCPFLDFLMPLITALGDHGIFCIALAVILLIPKRTRCLGLTLGGAYLIGFALGNGVLKNLTARIRPYDLENALLTADQLLVSALSDFSFPSGHTLVTVEAATVLMLRCRKPWGYIASVLALLVMFSRLYLYVHYPTDVLFGCLLGILFGYLAVKVVPMLYARAAAALSRRLAK